MKNVILIIGEAIRYNPPFFSYILREYEQVFGVIDDIKFINENDKNLPFLIEKMVSKYDYITIFATKVAYAIAGKILSTLTLDTLELKDCGTLAPSAAKFVVKDSFLLDIKGCLVNVLKADPLQKLPQILQDPLNEGEGFYLFDTDYASAKARLESLALSYKISFIISEYSSFLLFVRASEQKFGALDKFLDSVSKYYANSFIAPKNFISHAVEKLREIGAKITFAESCTAGLLAAKFGEIAGVSDIFDGSVVSYANEIKRAWLDVSDEVLQDYGAVSEQCVAGMLSGALESSGANFALAISGIAGPGGGSDEKPVGTVFIGAKELGGRQIIGKFHLNGDRNYIREEAANIAVCLLLKLRSDLFLN
ncbi:CinA family protein [Campylobacter sp. VBCF_06 NA8]|uniref:CinA family protein n=1 Tax=Campylobacter sp. VBCF_06 NA8 TaxID=2983822 RepID=UPI0022E99E30|nr:CinA family protein [Campylobacter sp. VBCF_06 NA8]MDA3046894.1 CinA family protein [Campylobacter sp. VBCF_06 NA8]